MNNIYSCIYSVGNHLLLLAHLNHGRLVLHVHYVLLSATFELHLLGSALKPYPFLFR